MGGYTSSTFVGSAQSSFIAAMVSMYAVDSSAISITGVSDAGGRRRLAASSVAVAFAVTTASAAAASSLAASISSVDAGAFTRALQASGLTACTGVVVSAPVVEAPALLNASSIDAGAVATNLASMNSSAAGAAQTEFLTTLSTAGLGNLSAAGASAAASLVMAVVSATATLSVASQNAALDILSSVASAPINVSGNAAQSITSALSSVASSAIASNPAALAQVQGVLSNLASSQASSLAAAMAALPPGAPPPAPAVTSSPTIQTLVQVDPPGGSRLTTQSLTAPGSPSAFAPMPGGVLPTTTAVVTQFFSLAFDPNGANSTLNTTGVTRLAFSNADGSPIHVANAQTPIRFTLPAVDTGGGEEQAVCSFWDTAAGAYATHGCAGVPSPYPANHSVYFFANFSTPDDASLAMAWNISGPMVDDGSCSVAVIDCNAESPPKIFPDPRSPLLVPAVACPPRPNSTNATGVNATLPRQPVLRVYFGSRCALWRPNNAYNCS